MKPLWCSVLLLCLSVRSERIAIFGEAGKNITLTCSFQSPRGSGGFAGLYLYHKFRANEEEVFFVNKYTPKKAVPRKNYEGRFQTEGTFNKLNIIIGNLTVNDSGYYRCVYKINSSTNDLRNTYAVFITDGSCCTQKEQPPSFKADKCLPLSYYFIISCVISAVITTTFLLLLRAKRWRNKRRSRSEQIVSNDCVYEEMRKSDVPKADSPPQSS
ncbi:uncharacterized protein si:rp71-81e14.2 isoform X2 [Cololabis saira]|uniref:uncharacterized protein si:rp71-81e14.2 isoform X2 n=1 Tax=Cololabis saira TaxID=129043 RepID=UPI002AD22471|nr:uncharacterized protein si:rp71-81e14.2 isoform X2 [Cololabis saira]